MHVYVSHSYFLNDYITTQKKGVNEVIKLLILQTIIISERLEIKLFKVTGQWV